MLVSGAIGFANALCLLVKVVWAFVKADIAKQSTPVPVI